MQHVASIFVHMASVPLAWIVYQMSMIMMTCSKKVWWQKALMMIMMMTIDDDGCWSMMIEDVWWQFIIGNDNFLMTILILFEMRAFVPSKDWWWSRYPLLHRVILCMGMCKIWKILIYKMCKKKSSACECLKYWFTNCVK